MNKHAYKDRRYEIVPYDPNWPNKFALESEKILSIFGGDVFRIEHIGSTAIPGMNGKPVIDILVLVNDVSAAHKHRDKMEEAGYEDAGEFVMHGAVLSRKMNGETLLSNVHIFQKAHRVVG